MSTIEDMVDNLGEFTIPYKKTANKRTKMFGCLQGDFRIIYYSVTRQGSYQGLLHVRGGGTRVSYEKNLAPCQAHYAYLKILSVTS